MDREGSGVGVVSDRQGGKFLAGIFWVTDLVGVAIL